MEYEIVSDKEHIQRYYEACRRNGLSHKLAEMFAFQMPPMSNTDREFLEGHCNGNQFSGQEKLGNYYRKESKANGIDTTGKIYLSSLASYPGDPRAWVSGRGDVQRLCEERGLNCEGSVTVKGREKQPVESVGIADDIVDRAVDEVLASDPGQASLPKEEVKAAVRERIKPHWSK